MALKLSKMCLIAIGLVLLSWPIQSFRHPPSRLVIPTYYEIHIAPQVFDTQAPDFLMANGKVIISVTAIQSNASVITLNADFDFITIDRALVQVREKGGKNLSIDSLIQDQLRTFLGIQLKTSLVTGNAYEVEIHYMAKLSQLNDGRELAGIFALEDTDLRNNITRYIAVTHFEPAYARRAFPCFDEPNLKARFELHIGRKGSYHSLSNMNMKESQEGADGWVWDVYDPTEFMSTYLVCFTVTEFIHFDAPAGIYGKPVKIWASTHLVDEGAGDFVAQSSAKTLQYFNNTFGIDYVFPKLDSIAISPFFGGMENWGLVVYDADSLQLGRQITEIDRDLSSNLIAHEIAAPEATGWSDLWLNEGFATYFSYHAQNAVTPEFELLERFCLDNNFNAMEFDEYPGTHPLKFGMDRPVDVALFSPIVYLKGAAVARMMELIFGKELFFKGLRTYVDNMQYQGAEQDDLFRILQRHVASSLPVDITVKDFLDTWTLQTGYPLVRVARADRNALEITQVEFSGKRYCSSTHTNTNESQPVTWHIPLSITTSSSQPNNSRQDWLRKGKMSTIVTGVNADQWVVVNTDGAGYFRVLYDKSLMSSLFEHLNADHTDFSTATRAMFINDYFTFAAEGMVQVDDAFEFTRYLGREKKGTPWSAFGKHFDQFAQLAPDNLRTMNIAAHYLSPRLDGLFETIGLREDNDARGYPVILRSEFLTLACPLRYYGCLIYGNEMFEQWKNSGVNSVPVHLRKQLYCGAVAGPNGNDAFNFFLEKYNTETDGAHKNLLVSALACSKSRAQLKRLLALAEDSQSGIELQDRWQVLKGMAVEIVGRDLTIEYIQNNLNKTFVTPALYDAVIFELSLHVYGESVIAKVENHVRMNEGGILRDVLSSIEAAIIRMRSNAEWMKSVGSRGFDWMESNLNE